MTRLLTSVYMLASLWLSANDGLTDCDFLKTQILSEDHIYIQRTSIKIYQKLQSKSQNCVKVSGR